MEFHDYKVVQIHFHLNLNVNQNVLMKLFHTFCLIARNSPKVIAWSPPNTKGVALSFKTSETLFSIAS